MTRQDIERAEERLRPFITRATVRYIQVAERGALDGFPGVTPEAVAAWAFAVSHHISANFAARRRRGAQTCALAYSDRQAIRWNPTFLLEAPDWQILDAVLHELGHLFVYEFGAYRGHGYQWAALGYLIGYAPIGSAMPARRLAYRRYTDCGWTGYSPSLTLAGRSA